MENNTVDNLETPTRQFQSLQNLADRRVRALKSLISMILTELNFLETLTLRSANPDLLETGKISLFKEVVNFEIEMIRTALLQTKGNQSKAAGLLGIRPTTLHEKMKRYGIESSAFSYLSIGKESVVNDGPHL